MKAYMSGSHYYVHIDEKEEFPSLSQKSLETNLQNYPSGDDLKKKILLSYDEKAKEVSVNFIPEQAFFDDIKEIRITLNKDLYSRLMLQRSYAHRFNNSSIDFSLESKISDFI